MPWDILVFIGDFLSVSLCICCFSLVFACLWFFFFFSINLEDILPGTSHEILEVGNVKPAGLIKCLEVPFPLCNSYFFEVNRVVLT